MSRVPLPPGFNDFARELESHRRSLSPRPPAVDRYPVFVRGCVLILGLLVGVVVFHATEQSADRAAFVRHGVVAEAEVVEVDHGQPVVRFTTAGGVEVTALARGGHVPESPLRPDVVHLSDEPGQVALADHRWPLWPWSVPVGLLLLGALVLQHRGGVRAGWFRRRVRVLRWGTPGQGSPWRRSLPWAVPAVALVALGIGLYTLPLSGSVTGTAPLWLCGFGAALVAYGLGLGVQALYRHAEHAPVRRAPRMFRPVPSWVTYVLLVTGLLVPGTFFLIFGLGSLATPDGDREHGTAEIVDYECAPHGRSCTYLLTVEYEADGLPHRGTIRVRESAAAENLIRAAEAPVSWDGAHPSDVRWEK